MQSIERRLRKLEAGADVIQAEDEDDPFAGMVPEYDPGDPESVREAHEKLFRLDEPWTQERTTALGKYYDMDPNDPEQVRTKFEETFGQPDPLRKESYRRQEKGRNI